MKAATIDSYQRRHPWLGFPLAVTFKFLDDKGVFLAALITYYGFLSLFPLLLVAGTGLRLALRDDPGLQQRLLGSALSRFPVIGSELQTTVHPLEGSGVALAVGVVVALYGGLGFTVAVQNAFNQVWGVPVDERPPPTIARIRGLVLLVVLGAGIGVTTGLAGLSTTPDTYDVHPSPVLRLLAVALSVLVNCALFAVAFRALTVRRVTFGQVLPGAVAAAVAWQALQSLGVLFVSTELQSTDELYGVISLVLALLAWIYLEALVVVFAAEVNAARVDRLWPRALLALGPETLTDADRRCYRSYAGTQRYKRYERISVEFAPEERSEKADVSRAPT